MPTTHAPIETPAPQTVTPQTRTALWTSLVGTTIVISVVATLAAKHRL